MTIPSAKNLSLEQVQIILDALLTINSYYSIDDLQALSEKLYGLEPDEAIEYAYDNVLFTAKQAVDALREKQ